MDIRDRIFSSTPAASRKERREFVRKLLLRRDFETLFRYVSEYKDGERILNSLLFDEVNLICCRAVEARGKIAAIKAKENIDSVRESIRRLLWAVNDESGNSVRHATMLIGEILANVPQLITEFAGYLPAFHDLSPYEGDVRWAMARIAAVVPTAFEDFTGMLLDSMNDRDPKIRGLALWALSPDACLSEARLIESLQKDPSHLDYYDWNLGEFCHTTVGEIARQVLIRK
jgi:hypothetical protein